jgi:hypothetical protein
MDIVWSEGFGTYVEVDTAALWAANAHESA